jgi:hypothetical protein
LRVITTTAHQPFSATKKKTPAEANMQDATLLANSAVMISFSFRLLMLVLVFTIIITLSSFTFLSPSLLISTSALEFSTGGTEESIFPSLLRSPVALSSLAEPPSEGYASLSFPADIYPASYPIFEGFLEPVDQNESSVFKIGSIIPIKFKLKYHDGQDSSAPADNKARIFTAKVSDSPEVGTINNKTEVGTEIGTTITATDSPAGSIASIGGGARAALPPDASPAEQLAVSTGTTDKPTPGNYFLHDPLTDEFVFNLGTRNLTPGTWQIQVILDDGSSYTSNISLIE